MAQSKSQKKSPRKAEKLAEGKAIRPSPKAPSAGKSKIDTLIALMRRPAGARIDELMAASGWQAHSVRGAIAGAIKRKLGLSVRSERNENARVYRIAPQ